MLHRFQALFYAKYHRQKSIQAKFNVRKLILCFDINAFKSQKPNKATQCILTKGMCFYSPPFSTFSIRGGWISDAHHHNFKCSRLDRTHPNTRNIRVVSNIELARDTWNWLELISKVIAQCRFSNFNTNKWKTSTLTK